MEFPAIVGNRPSHVLIDSGASHNFIHDALVSALNLPLRREPGSVKCGGNSDVSSLGKVYVPVKIDPYHETLEFIAMPLADTSHFQVVLGQTWLRAHSAVIDYSASHVTLLHDSQCLLLPFGVENSSHTYLSSMQFQRKLDKPDSKLFVMYLTATNAAPGAADSNSQPGAAHSLLKDFADVFADAPPGLPPERGIGHTIDTGDSPPVSRPMYRMSPKEKATAESMVQELLEKGSIRPGQSLYSSPILFVQKKGWFSPHVR
jgi:hypothetical protein